MASFSTNSLLDLCRVGISLKNEQTDTAARELSSYIVFSSLLEYKTNLPPELIERVVLLNDAVADHAISGSKYPQDLFDEEEQVVEAPTEDGPQLA